MEQHVPLQNLAKEEEEKTQGFSGGSTLDAYVGMPTYREFLLGLHL